MRFRAVVLCGAGLLALAGCATVKPVAGPGPLVLRSDPPGAAVELTDGTRCTTPCSLDVGGRHDVVATISLLGYKPVQAPIRIGPSGVPAPNPIDVTLVKEDPGGAAAVPATGTSPASKGTPPAR